MEQLFNKEFSNVYDQIYADKNYTEECNFICEAIEEYAPQTQSILDLGCGTGSHMLELRDRGYQMTGIDASPWMLELAKTKFDLAGHRSDLHQASLSTFALNQTYSTIIAMFSVLGYCQTLEDLQQTLERIHQHLKPGGLLIFDCWQKEGVLKSPPQNKSYQVRSNDEDFERISQSKILTEQSLVEVKFSLRNKQNSKLVAQEQHLIRYFTQSELKTRLTACNFHCIEVCTPWKLDSHVNADDWYMVVIAQGKK